MSSESPPALTPAQVHALFDILNHVETYREAENFKHSNAIREYGYPFTSAVSPQPDDPPSYASRSSSPLLQLLLTKCLLTVPGVADLPTDFWPYQFQGIMTRLAETNHSESYDKASLGTRKTLATGASVIHEAVTRGLLAGVPRRDERIDLKAARYDTTQASELTRAWNECVQELIHGNLANELFDNTAATADFESHSPAVAAAGKYAILHLASLMHHIFVLSSEGDYLLKLIENAYKLVPFSMVRQTLRIGNAASMITGMVRIFLAKMSIGGVTNWMGLTKGAEDGMNLMQRIISLVLSWDAGEFRKQASQVESGKDKDRPTKEQLAALREYMNMPASAHQALREVSTTQQRSIVAVILENTDPSLTESLNDAQHAHCLAWLSAELSARDRDEITKVLCKSQPDFLTAALRGAVDTYEPFIRAIHEGMDLREHISAVETFLNDLFETSKAKKLKGGGGSSKFKKNGKTKTHEVITTPPSVEDYVALLNRNKGLLFTYLHQVAKNCVDLRERFKDWAHVVIAEFRTPQHGSNSQDAGAGAMSAVLQDMYASLPPDTRNTVLARLDAHAGYLAELDALSEGRMQRVLDQLHSESGREGKTLVSGSGSGRSSPKPASSPASPRTSTGHGASAAGPGVFLMRWGSLLDATPITPATPSGPVRCGRDVKGQKAWGKTAVDDVAEPHASVVKTNDGGRDLREPEAPDVRVVMEALGGRFREVVNDVIGEMPPTGKRTTRSGIKTGVGRASNAQDLALAEAEDLTVGVNGIALAG